MKKIEERWEEKMREVVKRGTQLLLVANPERVLLMMDCTKENPLYSELYKQTKQLEKQLQKEIQMQHLVFLIRLSMENLVL